MELPATIKAAAAVVTSIGVIGGGTVTLNKMHVSADDFERYIQQQQMADERDYVRELKRDIRDVQGALLEDPDEPFLLETLLELIDELCEYRPNDRLCDDDN